MLNELPEMSFENIYIYIYIYIYMAGFRFYIPLNFDYILLKIIFYIFLNCFDILI
jgi:hypothetical protein